MHQPQRNIGSTLSSGYRYSFQGQESDDDIKGEGNPINYTFRMHDPRVGRFFAVDPLAAFFPHNSPYAFSENRVIDGVELEEMEIEDYRVKFYNEMITASIKALNSMETSYIVKDVTSPHGKSEKYVKDFSANKYKSLYMVAQRRMENGFNSTPPGNNPFNIKGQGDAGSATYSTHEYYGGQKTTKTASFSSYSTLDAGIAGYLDLLKADYSDAYDALMDDSNTIDDFSSGLLNNDNGDSYATNPIYQQEFRTMLIGVVADVESMLTFNLAEVQGQISSLKLKIDGGDFGLVGKYFMENKLEALKRQEAEIKSDIEELNEFKKNEGIE